MEQTRKILLIELYSYLAVMILILFLFETNIIMEGAMVGNGSLIYLQFIMQLLTLMVIPLALYMFKIKKIEFHVRNQHSTKGFLTWGSFRMALLCVPTIINILLYYVYGEEVGFFYLALILLISMFFIYPSKARCDSERNINKEEINKKNETNP